MREKFPENPIKIQRVAVIGAGASGLAVVKSLLEWGLEPVVFEKGLEIGGLWTFDERKPSGGGLAYRSLLANTSRRMMAFSDFPFPTHTPEFPSRSLVLDYLNAYADAFNLRSRIRFRTIVEQAARTPSGGWRLRTRTADGPVESQDFDAVVVASGFYRKPYRPKIEGQAFFQGEICHSADYVGPESLTGRRVIVVGCGSSGADISAEVSSVAAQVDVSTRSGVWFIPKMIEGRPYDTRRTRFSLLLPKWIAQRTFHRVLIDSYRALGFSEETLPLLQLPEFDLDRGHFIPATDILGRILNGAVRLKPEIARIEAKAVVYADGSTSAADVILFCTGYSLAFPFLDETVVQIQGRYTFGLFHQVFHRQYDNLAFVAMNFAGGSALPLMEIQSRWLARVFAGDLALPGPEERGRWIDAYFEKHRQSGTDPMSLKLPAYLAELGEILGVRPRLWKHPRLFLRLLFGPLLPAQYRLEGPGSTPDARKTITGSGSK